MLLARPGIEEHEMTTAREAHSDFQYEPMLQKLIAFAASCSGVHIDQQNLVREVNNSIAILMSKNRRSFETKLRVAVSRLVIRQAGFTPRLQRTSLAPNQDDIHCEDCVAEAQEWALLYFEEFERLLLMLDREEGLNTIQISRVTAHTPAEVNFELQYVREVFDTEYEAALAARSCSDRAKS